MADMEDWDDPIGTESESIWPGIIGVGVLVVVFILLMWGV